MPCEHEVLYHREQAVYGQPKFQKNMRNIQLRAVQFRSKYVGMCVMKIWGGMHGVKSDHSEKTGHNALKNIFLFTFF